MTASLELEQEGVSRSYPLSGHAVVLGRGRECDVRLDSPSVSRRHARIVPREAGWVVEDLGSRNGTRLNDAPLSVPAVLEDGDLLEVGEALLRFRVRRPSPSVRVTDSMPEVTVLAVRGGDRPRCEVDPQAALDAVLEVQRAVTTLELDPLLERVLDVVLRLYPHAARGVLVLLGEDGELVPKVVRVKQGVSDTMPLSRTLLRRVIENREAVLSEDVATDPQLSISASLLRRPVTSLLCAPLLGRGGRPVGAIQMHTEGGAAFTPACLDVLAAVANAAGLAVDNARLHGQALERDRLRRSLEHAREVQRCLLPSAPPEVAGYEFFVHEEAADSVGGDYLGFLPLENGRIAIAVGDVSGKGMPAALLSARLTSEVQVAVTRAPDPEAALARLDDALAAAGPEGRFVTFLLTVLEPRLHLLSVANAGHPPPLRRRDGRVEELQPGRAGVPLGVGGTPELRPRAGDVTLEPGDVIVAYTDGVTELQGPGGEELGLERLRGAIAAAPPGAAGTGEAVVTALREFAAGRRRRDDTTLVCIGRLR